jgi:hypothetical protein
VIKREQGLKPEDDPVIYGKFANEILFSFGKIHSVDFCNISQPASQWLLLFP